MDAAVYILSNRYRNVLYTGVTSSLARRLFEHKRKHVPGFTSKYSVDVLVYFELFERITDAIEREKMIKKKSRRGKIRLIESINSEWRDLSKQM